MESTSFNRKGKLKYGFSTTVGIHCTSFDRVTDPDTPRQSASAPHYPLGGNDVPHERETYEQGHGASSAFAYLVDAYACSSSSDFRSQSTAIRRVAG